LSTRDELTISVKLRVDDTKMREFAQVLGKIKYFADRCEPEIQKGILDGLEKIADIVLSSSFRTLAEN